MKKIFFILVLCLPGNFVFSQSAPDKQILISSRGDTIRSSDKMFTKVEIESTFPGGAAGWQQFLMSNLKYPDKAVNRNVQGTVVLQFIVCTDGTVCNIEAVSGPKLLRQAAVDAIKNTPDWIPAQVGGRKVKSFKRQPIVFQLTR